MSGALFTVYDLGLIAYDDAYRLQKDIRRRVIDGETGDTLLILEHPPTITVGKAGKPENVLVSQTQLTRDGVSLFFADRGGDVTYHGPGQLVAYPIVDLKKRGAGAHQYVHDLEEVVIKTLEDFSIRGCRDAVHSGVCAGSDEIAAIGISLKKWVTMHGVALNISTDLRQFALINPCGFTDRKATSMSRFLSRDVPVKDVAGRFLLHFSEVFDTRSLISNAGRLESASIDMLAGGTYGKPASSLV